MIDVRSLLDRQAAWQKARRTLTWPEKIRMVEAVRMSIIRLRRSGGARIPSEQQVELAPGAAPSDHSQSGGDSPR
jgi:hypothetical protein